MIKRLAVPFLVIAAGMWGCSSSSNPKTDTGAGGSGGGTGGTGGGTGGTGGGTGGTGGVDAAVPAGICSAYVAGSGALPNIAAAAYCAEYMTTCMFGGTNRYANLGDCQTKYAAQIGSVQTCRAGHLCNAKANAAPGTATHCDHATGFGAIAACIGTNADGGAAPVEGGAAGICGAYVAGSGALAGIAAAAYCAEYATTCMFGGANRYLNMGDCTAKYTAQIASVQTCRAGHLCNAKANAAPGTATHCDHATGFGAVAACIGTNADGGAGAEAGAEGGASADFCATYTMTNQLPSIDNIAAADFCTKYTTVCTFAGANRYMNMNDCMTRYSASAAAVQGCRAAHLCNANIPGGVGTHCPHATGIGLCM